jgi:diamine N-acetyltransferase
MSKEITLREVTKHNWEDVVDLEVTDEQDDFLDDNAHSLAESKFNPYARPRAIYAGKRVVGFLMYETLEEEDRPDEVMIYRFMIDERYQGKGYGRAAFGKAIDEIRRMAHIRKIEVCYKPENASAKALYASQGFREIGRDEDGETIAELKLR